MEFQWIARMFGRAQAGSATPERKQVVGPALASSTLRYPPSDIGLALRPPADILGANQDLLHRLKLHAAVEAPAFESRFAAPLLRLASYINVLPATATAHFSGDTGQFRACLEMAFYCFQASDGRIFTGQEGVEQRHALEWRWRYLCFLAGLFYPLGKSIERIVVAGPTGTIWKRHFHGVTEWAQQERIERVFVSWGSTDVERDVLGPSSAASALIPHIVGADNLQMLEDGTSDLVAALYQLVAGAQGTSRIAHQVVTTCWDRVSRREAARRPQAFGRLTSGTHQGPYLIGAVRALVQKGTWKVNESHLRADSKGLYLFWPEAARDLIAHGQALEYAGWPDNAPTIAQLLRAASIVMEGPGDLGCVEVVDEAGEIRPALQFANPLAVLEDFNPDTYRNRASVTLEGVLEKDPLVAAETHAAAGVRASPSQSKSEGRGAGSSVPAAAPDQQALALEDGDADSSDQPIELAAARGALVEVLEVEAPTARIKEAPDVRYSDLVPEDIRNELGSALHAELLGKVVKAWKDRAGKPNELMRRIDHGAAIAMTFLTTNMKDAPTWVDVMAKAGLIYSPPQTPGLRIHKVSIPEGRTPVNAVVLSNLACRRLGL